MSIDQLTSGAQSLANTVSSGQNVTNRLASDLGAGGAGDAGSWLSKLRPASFRGVPFKVLEGQLKFDAAASSMISIPRYGVGGRPGPRCATYCFHRVHRRRRRNRAARPVLKVCEEVGAVEGGELVHPTLGRMTVSLVDGVSCAERWDRGRVFELAFSFVEQGKRIFPNSAVDTQSAVSAAADKAKAAAKSNLIAAAAGALKSGLAVVGQATSAVSSWAQSAQRLVNDATNLYHFVQTMPGSLAACSAAMRRAPLALRRLSITWWRKALRTVRRWRWPPALWSPPPAPAAVSGSSSTPLGTQAAAVGGSVPRPCSLHCRPTSMR
jgi:hypothetical protein